MEKRANPPKGSAGAYMRRIRQITTLDFAEGNYQAQNILKFCAAIDGNSRAYPEDQEKLWSKVLNIPNNTIVYLIGYHNPPAIWEGLTQSSTDKNTHDPMKFYTMQRLTSLSSARVRYLNLSIDLPEKAVGLK
jgi:superoxide dismutase